VTSVVGARTDPQQQHRALGAGVVQLSSEKRPEPGPIALLPGSQDVFAAAIRAGGGTVQGLSPATRGLVWLSYARPSELDETLRANPQIQWVQLPWAGVDAFSDILKRHSRPRMVWTSGKGAFAQPVAEHALALTLALLRVLPKRVRATSWNSAPEGISLYGRHVVVIGAGGITQELLRLLAPFGARVTVIRRSTGSLPGAARTLQSDQLHAVLPAADVVVLAAALTDDTRHLIGAEALSLMHSGSYLVNVARGGLVDTDALVAALAGGEIAGAGLDVTDPEPLPDGHPLWLEPRCLVTPHMADTPDMTAPLLAGRIRENVAAFLGDGRFVGVVDPALGY
jgi:phosphoglycerate dehydrogenase-like enzyme